MNGKNFFSVLKESLTSDKNLLISGIALILFGIATQFTANYPDALVYFKKHLLYIAIGIPFFLFFATVELKFILRYSMILHIISIILLIIVLLSGGRVHRWIYLGNFQFQPSEIAKLTLIVFIPRLLSRKPGIYTLRDSTMSFLVAGITAGLVLIEPDFGTAVIIFLIFMGIYSGYGLPQSTFFLIISPLLSVIFSFHIVTYTVFFVFLIGVVLASRRKFILTIILLLLNIGVGLTTPVLWNMLKPYQKARLLVFLNPYKDPTGSGWHIIQSKISIGSGGLLGKGYLKGQLKTLKFIPMKNTDFVFSVIGEELGFIGTFLLIALYTYFLIRVLDVALKSRGRFTRLIGLGIFFYFFFHFVVNVGMCLGLLPVVGLPLPFLSYGGTNLVISLSLLGLMLNLKRNQYEYI